VWAFNFDVMAENLEGKEYKREVVK